MSATLSPLFTWRTAIAKSSLPPTVRHVALTLSLYMSERGGSAWPSITTLAADSGLSPASVKRGTKALEKAGYLRCERKKGLSTHYMAAAPTHLVFPQDQLTQNRAQTEPGSQGDGTGLTVTPDPAHPEPLPRHYHDKNTPEGQSSFAAGAASQNGKYHLDPHQVYLLERIHLVMPSWRKSLTFGAITKLAKAHKGGLTEGLEDLWQRVGDGDVGSVGNPYAYLETMSRRTP